MTTTRTPDTYRNNMGNDEHMEIGKVNVNGKFRVCRLSEHRRGEFVLDSQLSTPHSNFMLCVVKYLENMNKIFKKRGKEKLIFYPKSK